MIKQGTVLVCDLCGHEWLSKIMPARCAKCKSSKWNRGYFEQPNQIATITKIQSVQHVAGCRCYICKPPKE